MNPDKQVAVLLSDEESIFNDYLYFYFRIYKKNLIKKLFSKALDRILEQEIEEISVAEIGSGNGYDALNIMNILVEHPKTKTKKIKLTLAEGLKSSIEKSKDLLEEFNHFEIEYLQMDFNQSLPMKSGIFDIVICTEVIEHIKNPNNFLKEIFRTQKNDSYFILTTDNSPNLLQKIKRFPLLLIGRYNRKYKKVDPDLDPDTFYTEMNNDQIPIYGHINLKTCTQWEKIFKSVGYTISSLGTYESVRRGGGNQSPPVLFFYFFWSTISSLLPSFLSKHIGDTTAFIASKRHH